MQLSDNYSMIHTAIDDGIDIGMKKGEKERQKLQETLDIKEKALAQKNEALTQKDEALAQKDNIITNAIKNLVSQGLSPQQIAQILQLDVEEVKKNISPNI
jgi:ATP/maltotriose-dependent transcriptional regulator MalT